MRWPNRIRFGGAAALTFALLSLSPVIALAAAGDVELVSVRLPNQSTANNSTWQAQISADGRFAVFASNADDLVHGDTNGYTDIFVETLSSGAIERVSVSSSGVQANNISYNPQISGDGRFVLFASTATNLTATDDVNNTDYFIRDRQSGTTERLTLNGQSLPVEDGPVLSGNGRYVAFTSYLELAGDNNDSKDVYVYDRQTSSVDLVSVSSSGQIANHGPLDGVPAITPDGRFVVFISWATNLVPGDTNGLPDVFIRDRQTGVTERVSVNSAEQQSNDAALGDAVISADGRFVGFSSLATNLVANDTNGAADVFVRDRQQGTTTRVNLGAGGAQASASSDSGVESISDDGRFVSFVSTASNLVPGDTNGAGDYFVRDRQAGVTQRLDVSANGAQADSGSDGGGMSADGSLAIFITGADNLVPRDRNESADAFVRDLATSTTVLVSRSVVPSNAADGGTDSAAPAVSGNGRLVAFSSQAGNIVAGDDNHQGDVFVRDLVTNTTEIIGGGPPPANSPSTRVESHLGGMSADGRFVVFQSWAADLVPNDTNGNNWDIFVHDRQTGQNEIVSRDPSGAQVTESLDGQDFYFDNTISADGRYVAWDTTASVVPEDSNTSSDIYLRDRQAGTTEWISRRIKGNIGNRFSRSNSPSLSSDGRYVAFYSEASNMVLNDTNRVADIFVRDRMTGVAERVSVATDGTQSTVASFGPSISADGRYVAFYSNGNDLVPSNDAPYQIFVRDRQTGVTELVVSSDRSGSNPRFSADGRFIAYTLTTTDLNTLLEHSDVYRYDRYTGVIEKVNDDSSGQLGTGSAFEPALNPTGRYAVFQATPYDTRDFMRINTYRRDSGIASVPPFALTPTNMNFGTRARGSASNRTVTVINTGAKALSLASVTLAAQNAGQFALTSHCGNTLAVGASCLIQVAFKPTAAGAKSAELRVTATGLPFRTVNLKGSGN